jgi:flagellar capping protein FliD
MAQLYANNAYSTLASGINNSVTTLALATGEGARFPSPTGSDYFLATLTQAGTETSWEIVKVTARSTDTLTIVRAQEGTAAASWATGDKVQLRLTAAPATTYEAAVRRAHALAIILGI